MIRIHARGDRDLQVMVYAFPGMNYRLETHRFAPAGSRDGGAQLLLTGRIEGPPPGFGQRLANDLLASDLCLC
jgi:hypothetical protein